MSTDHLNTLTHYGSVRLSADASFLDYTHRNSLIVIVSMSSEKLAHILPVEHDLIKVLPN